MTLNSLNTQYAKLISKTAVMGVSLVVVVSLLGLTHWCAEASGFNHRSAVTTPLFVDEQKLTASDAAVGDGFGRSVAFSGSTVVVGAPQDDIRSNTDQGSVYVFTFAWVALRQLSRMATIFVRYTSAGRTVLFITSAGTGKNGAGGLDWAARS